MIVQFLPDAENDLKEIHAYIGRDNSVAADRLISRILDKLSLLASMPEIGRPGRVAGTRELVIPPSYIAVYRIRDMRVQVLAVRHTARRWPKGFAGA